MPTISIFFGIVVQMYWRDHPPPHLHAYYQGFEALVSLESGDIIGGHIPIGALRIIKQWVAEKRPELMANWERARLLQALQAVPGADQN
jgi:Domain of unknown function (DUF4160)